MDLGFLPILILLIMLVSVYLLVYGVISRKCIFNGRVWGIDIHPTPKQEAFIKKGKNFMIFGIIGVVITGMPSFGAWFNLLFTATGLALLYFPVLIGLAVTAIFVCKKDAENPELMQKADNALVLGEISCIKAAEAHIDKAQAFIVGFDGIAFIDNRDYCYAVEHYQNHMLGNLGTPNEVALVASYFAQKYGDTFSYKADFERIPGEPGQRVTFIGSGGINVAYTSGTKMQSTFRSFIFTRK